jgi:hypothetical protein
MWISLLPSKDQASTTVKRVQATAERKSGNLLGGLRTDRGGEFTTTQFSEYYVELRIIRELTAPYTSAEWCGGEKKSVYIGCS